MDTLIVAVRVVLSLGVVLALLWYLQRRLSRGVLAKGSINPVTVVGRQPIGQKASVVVVEVDGTRLVLGVTEQAVTVLHEKSLVSVSPSTLDAAVAALGSPDSAGTAFARSLAAATADDAAAVPTAARPAGLAGSILSPSTWRQTAALLRQGR
ncbi:flagellar biosynthetic protein FliO [Cryobacterium sp. PH31-O1]|uniref:flagellar biosynthetic protein FliO n=1 Tax=Cryobacterium sp. PH31-O1 TaxID=3046306 RepID=UPI0024BBBB8A|nr:flagellar biosynthetic protein FliO [Cryobacterium sp. PH31-O1]MDJ0338880.1 flagellar biosynthetic protein FliO [Cryobacterium sp. PH31-O1]